MSLLQKIPLLNSVSDQLVAVDLGINPYVLRVLWNERFKYFSLSILEADKTPLLLNVKMVNDFPLNDRFEGLKLPVGDLYFVQETGESRDATYEDIGINFNLYYFEPDLVSAVAQVLEQTQEAVSGTIWDTGTTEWDEELGGTLWDI